VILRTDHPAFEAVEISDLSPNDSPTRAINTLRRSDPADRECCLDAKTPPCLIFGWAVFFHAGSLIATEPPEPRDAHRQQLGAAEGQRHQVRHNQHRRRMLLR